MPAQRIAASERKSVVSLTEMAQMLGMSRTRLYQLIDKGVFEPAVYCVVTRRPFFTADIQLRNLEYRRTNTSAAGGFHCFYRAQRQANGEPSLPARGRANHTR